MPLSALTRIFCLLLISINVMDGQSMYQSLMLASIPGLQYSPADLSIQLISFSIQLSFKACATACHNNPFCRIFDYGADGTEQCRLFEGDLGVMGSLLSSSSSSSEVGSVQLAASLFTQYGQSCSSVCSETRYLVCNINSQCECWPHFYWNAAMGMCLAQVSVEGASCVQGVNMCRGDLNLSCLTTLDQCQCNLVSEVELSFHLQHEILVPIVVFPLVGVTVADVNTVIQGSGVVGVQHPWGITMYDGSSGESLIFVDWARNAVLYVSNVLSSNRSASLLLQTWPTGGQFNGPLYVALDRYNHSNLYVSDNNNDRVMLFFAMQAVSPIPTVVAGVSGVTGSTPDKLYQPNGMALDDQSNLYVADTYNNRVMLWPANSPSGIMVAGTGVAGNSSWDLQRPMGLFLNRQNTLLYVADAGNQRIQVFCLNGTPPYNGTTVAGGNGYGSNSNQLSSPSDVWVSETTGNIYIADSANHRIQRWSPDATSGVTFAGDPGGMSGSDATRFIWPYAFTINANETRMYVSDWGNQRVQLFNLV